MGNLPNHQFGPGSAELHESNMRRRPCRRVAVDGKRPLCRITWPTVSVVESHPKASELVPVEALRSGDPITDVNGGGQRYVVLESKAVGESCVVLELESKANDQLRVIEKSFPAGYEVGRSPRRIL